MRTHRSSLMVGMLVLAMLSMGSVAGATGSPELVVNGGFETGDLTGWTQSGDTSYSAVENWGAYAPSGSYVWDTGSLGMGYLSQTIYNSLGSTYDISFDLGTSNYGGDPLGEFTASFGGIQLLDLTNQSDFWFTHYSFTINGYTPTSAELMFSFYNIPGGWYLDNVSVTDLPYDNPVPEPSTWLLFGSGLAGLVAWRYRTGKRATA